MKNIYNKANDRWKKKKIVRTVVHKKILGAGAYFGDLELIRNCKRINKITVIDDSFTLYLNKKRFFESK